MRKLIVIVLMGISLIGNAQIDFEAAFKEADTAFTKTKEYAQFYRKYINSINLNKVIMGKLSQESKDMYVKTQTTWQKERQYRIESDKIEIELIDRKINALKKRKQATEESIQIAKEAIDLSKKNVDKYLKEWEEEEKEE